MLWPKEIYHGITRLCTHSNLMATGQFKIFSAAANMFCNPPTLPPSLLLLARILHYNNMVAATAVDPATAPTSLPALQAPPGTPGMIF
jgi:hypothetical protein